MQRVLLLLFTAWLLTACMPAQLENASNPMTTPTLPANTETSMTGSVPATSTVEMPNQAIQSATVANGGEDAQYYLDDRSTPEAVMRSFANALNRREYVRAYSYWAPDAQQLAPLPQFEEGYTDTESVQIAFGPVNSDAGAGSVYHRVPVTWIAHNITGEIQTFIGCYVLHLANPANQGTLPFRPLAIQSAEVEQVPNDTDTRQLMDELCAVSGTEWTREQFNTAWDIAYPAGWTVNAAGAHEGAIQLQGAYEGHTYQVNLFYPIGIAAQSLDAWVEEQLAALTPEERAGVDVSDLTVGGTPAKQVLNLPAVDGSSPVHTVYIWRTQQQNPRQITISQSDAQPVDTVAMASLLAQFLAQVRS